MAKRLKDIPTSCRMFDKAISSLDNIKQVVDTDVWDTIEVYIEYAKGYIEEGRDVNGDLRDTCVEIAETKDKEMMELEDKYQDEIKDLNSNITDLQDKVEELEKEISLS